MRVKKMHFISSDQVGLSELWHFIYKSRSSSQFTSPIVGPPYHSEEERERYLMFIMIRIAKLKSATKRLRISQE